MSKSRIQQAREAGPHGSQIHADGSKQSDPNQHKSPLKGEDPGLPDNLGENYRVGEHYGSKEMKQGGFDPKEPKPKGPAAIDRDSDYKSPTGPSTTRAPLKKK